jgi:hypothetical protein
MLGVKEKFRLHGQYRQNPHILAMSALLTTTMRAMKDTVEYLEQEGLRDKVKIYCRRRSHIRGIRQFHRRRRLCDGRRLGHRSLQGAYRGIIK